MICTCCDATDHDIEHCPLLTLQLNRQKVITRHVYSRSQERSIYKRKYRKRLNSLFRYKEIESKALKIEIPANFSSSCDKSENSDENNTNGNNNAIKGRSDNQIKPKIDSLIASPKRNESSVKCYETFDDLGIPLRSPSSTKKPSYLGDSKSRLEKKEDSWKFSALELEPLNPKFCSLEMLLDEKNKRKLNEGKNSAIELNPNLIKGFSEEDKEKDDSLGTVLTANSQDKSKINPVGIVGSNQKINKKSVFNKNASNEELNKRNSSYGSFSTNSLQNLNLFKEDNFFQTDEVLGGTTKGNTTTIATIQEFLLKNFETMCSYKYYYPHNNFENVIKWCRILGKGKKTLIK